MLDVGYCAVVGHGPSATLRDLTRDSPTVWMFFGTLLDADRVSIVIVLVIIIVILPVNLCEFFFYLEIGNWLLAVDSLCPVLI